MYYQYNTTNPFAMSIEINKKFTIIDGCLKTRPLHCF